MQRTNWHAATTAIVFFLTTGSAQAHAPSSTVGDFYAGALHPLTSLEHVLAFIAFGLLGGQQGERAQPAVLIFAAALIAGAALARVSPALPAIDLVNIGSAVILGLLVAAAFRLPLAVLYAIAAIFGLTHGYSNGAAMMAPLKPWLYLPGVGLSGLLVAAYGFVILDWVARRNSTWMPIAVRVAGSWIAAIGILVLGVTARSLLIG